MPNHVKGLMPSEKKYQVSCLALKPDLYISGKFKNDINASWQGYFC